MKKLLLLLFISNFSLLTAQADEGMWTLYNLPNAVSTLVATALVW